MEPQKPTVCNEIDSTVRVCPFCHGTGVMEKEAVNAIARVYAKLAKGDKIIDLSRLSCTDDKGKTEA